ncbi:hypothetical protein NC651_004345 [Populus alba x Populus x berolinensis]|nr:hypothetical protein NC651_004345 [Populus alba x Populus x berolinensis]
MKGYWYFLEVFKESKKRIGPHTDHYNCIFGKLSFIPSFCMHSELHLLLFK